MRRLRSQHALLLCGIVAASFVVRALVALLRPTPDLFPDEYTYAELSRSIAEGGIPLVRGEIAWFPALLQPVLTAPAWLVGDVGVSYRLVQGLGAFAMSLAAVPAYLLARRLGVSARLSLGVALLAVLVPDLVYTTFVVSEPVAYPLVLAAVATATAALAQPTRKHQLWFVAFALLATLARIQFAVLPLVFLVALVAVGLRERRLRAALREQALPLGVFTGIALAATLVGAQALGQYEGGLGADYELLGTLRWAALDAMAVAYACGWIIIPGAPLGLVLAVRRPRGRAELAFACVATVLAAATLLQAGLIQAGLPRADMIQERYVFYLVPLLGIAFALYAGRGWPARVPHLLLAALLVLVSMRIPLSEFATPFGVGGSPFLFAVAWLGRALGAPASASLAVAVLAALLSAVAVVASRAPRFATPVVVAFAAAAMAAASAGAVAFDSASTNAARDRFLPRDPSWVDNAGLGSVAMVRSWGGLKTDALSNLFWNRSIERVVVLPGGARFDSFRHDRASIRGDGTLLAGGAVVRGPLLVDGYGATVRVRNGRVVARSRTHALWSVDGTPQLASYVLGRYFDGWLASSGAIYLWPERVGGSLRGTVTFSVRAPAGRRIALRIGLSGGERRMVNVEPGRWTAIELPVCSRGRWETTFVAGSQELLTDLRAVSVLASEPRSRASGGSCPVQRV